MSASQTGCLTQKVGNIICWQHLCCGSIARLTCIDDDNVSIPDGVTILTPPASMVFPSHNRVIRTDNLPWYLFNQGVQSQIILRKALSNSTRFMTTWDSDNLGHSIHDPRLATTSQAQKDLVPSSIFTTNSVDNISLDLESMFDPLQDVWLSWVNASPNSMVIDLENQTSLTMLLQKAITKGFGTSLESIYKTYIVEDNRAESFTALNLDTHSNPMWS